MTARDDTDHPPYGCVQTVSIVTGEPVYELDPRAVSPDSDVDTV